MSSFLQFFLRMGGGYLIVLVWCEELPWRVFETLNSIYFTNDFTSADR